MRTSNKILLGIFVLPLAVLATVNTALYTKYKAGHYVAMTTIEQERFIHQPLKTIKYVTVYGLNNFTLKQADTAKLEIEKDEHGHLHYSIIGDSLIIHGDSTIKRAGDNEVLRSYQNVNLYLPDEVSITADNSNVYLQGAKDSVKAQSMELQLRNSSTCQIPDGDFDNATVPRYFNALSFQAAGSSGIELSNAARISTLNLDVTNSQFDDKSAAIGRLVISADKTSSLTLRGDNLQKLKP